MIVEIENINQKRESKDKGQDDAKLARLGGEKSIGLYR